MLPHYKSFQTKGPTLIVRVTHHMFYDYKVQSLGHSQGGIASVRELQK